MKIIIFSLAIFCLLISGCSNDPVVQGNTPIITTSLDPFWELPIGSDSTIEHYYGLEITEFNGVLTGSADIIDTIFRYTGDLIGTRNRDTIILEADFAADQYDFGFTGIKSGNIISGKLIFNNSGSDTLDASLLSATKKVFDFGTNPPPNPYIFRTIFTTPNPTGPPVVFVHGMGGTLREWDTLLSSLDANFKSRHNVYSFQYNWQDSIMINGRILKDSITAKGLVNPILVCHSMGGLVSRAYVANGGQITKLVTLGTPHLGSALSDLGFIVSFLNNPGPLDMKPSSNFIQNMLTNTLDVQNRNKYYCISGIMGGYFQVLPLPSHWVWFENYYKDMFNGMVCTGWKLLLVLGPNRGPNDGLVNVESALFENGNTNHPLPLQYWVDHMHLNYPSLAPEIFNYINNL